MGAGITDRARRLLDRPGLRWALAAAANLRVLAKPSEVRRVQYRRGLWIHHMRDGFIVDRQMATQRSLALFDAQTRNDWGHVYTPSPGDTIVDVGAGIGSEVYTFARAVGPSGSVVAIEANPKTCDCLRRFCELNGFSNVHVLNVAVADSEGVVSIQDAEHHISNTITGDRGDVLVRSARLDDLLSETGVGFVDYLKMNIEGAEMLALQGMSSPSSRIAAMTVSCHDFKADRGEGEHFRTRQEVSALLAGSGFRLVARDDPRPWIRDQVNAVSLEAREKLHRPQAS